MKKKEEEKQIENGKGREAMVKIVEGWMTLKLLRISAYCLVLIR